MQPETNQEASYPKSPKAPIIVIIIAWFILLWGILRFGWAWFWGLLSVENIIESPSLLLGHLISLLIIIVAFGLRKMKKWALYLFLFNLLISIFEGVIEYIQIKQIISLQVTLILLIISAYLVYIREKFN